MGGEQSLRITSLYPSPASRSFTGLALAPQSRKGAVVNPQAHTLDAVVVGLSLASAERRGARRGAWGNLSSLDGFGRRACAHHSTATAATGIPGVVLSVADGIVRIAGGIIRAAARLSRGIDCLVGVAAGEEKCCDHDRDAEPHRRFPTHWSQPAVRLVDAHEKSAITRSFARGGDLIEQRTLNFNSMRRQEWSRLSPDTRRG